MRDGRLVAVERMATTSESELVERIVGRALRPSAPQRPPAGGWVDTPLLSMTGVIAGNAGPVDLALHRGEILGLVGLRGAGQEAVGRAMFGCEPRLAGQIRVAGRALPLRAPAEAIAAGIGFCAAERLELNLAGAMSVQENLFPNPGLHGEPLLDFARRRRERLRAGEWLERLEVSPRAPQAVVHTLSGGNQQKVVLARWESLALPVQILEEPTAGVDVGAKQQIYARLRVRAESGAGLVIVSTDFDEIAHLCSRVLVFRAGRIVAELRGADVCVPRLLSLAAGTLAAERHAA
jgi:ribose transport system ATP-binding protein